MHRQLTGSSSFRSAGTHVSSLHALLCIARVLGWQQWGLQQHKGPHLSASTSSRMARCSSADVRHRPRSCSSSAASSQPTRLKMK